MRLVLACLVLLPLPAWGQTAAAEASDAATRYGIWATLPPFVAIVSALVTKRAILSLVLGIFAGALVLAEGSVLTASARTVDKYMVGSIADSGNASILLFSVLLGGMIGVLAASGATRELVSKVARGTSRRAAMLGTFFSGMVVFFDDYANCLLVGSTMRPVTDERRVSREKLAYIVDSTAAPLATIAIASTWVGYQVGLLNEALPASQSGYAWFIDSLPYAFYPLFTLFFVMAIAASGRDFGPMAKAEARAGRGDGVSAPDAKPLSEDFESDESKWPHGAWVVVATLVTLVGVLAAALYHTGQQGLAEKILDPSKEVDFSQARILLILGEASSTKSLLWSGFAATFVALALVVATGRMKIAAAMDGWIAGAKSMFTACAILILAWSLGAVCKADGLNLPAVAAEYLPIAPWLIPSAAFVLAGAIAFAVGSSYTTMGILIPVAAGIVFTDGFSGSEHIQIASIAAIMGGAVFGDHCSPISDTTIMSSMGAGCDHLDHVKTQLPYAVTTGIATILVGYLPIGLGAPPLVCLILGPLALYGILRLVGRPLHANRAGKDNVPPAITRDGPQP